MSISVDPEMERELALLEETYCSVRPEILSRLESFRRLGEEGSEEELFHELVFCLLTPQSRARICWRAVENLMERGLLKDGTVEEISKELRGVRFRNNKAGYIVDARALFAREGRIDVRGRILAYRNIPERRDGLVRTVKGMGYKEASHFLRNIGSGDRLAILDRHILKNLVRFRVIDAIPASLSKGVYLRIEESMNSFARKIGLPLPDLDLLFWFRETGDIFK